MNRKKIIVLISCVFVTCLVIIFAYNKSFNKNKHIEEIKENSSNKVPDMVSIMLETGVDTNKYELSSSNEYPTSKYEFNSVKSKCENGGTLTWNDTTNKLVLKTNISDKCYAYFDVLPPDVTVNISNRPTTLTERKIGVISCTNSNATYNQQYNRIEISSIDKKYTSCTLNYTDSTSKVNLADYIIGLSGKTQGSGKVLKENGYRYEGKNPNNYIWFNNEYWRIIGVFDSASHGQSNKNLVKIIRDDVLDGLAWDKSNTNNWDTSSLKSLLNGAYYNAQDGTSSGYCYGYSTTITANCDYTKRGIQSGYRGMIASVTWHLSGYSSTNYTTDVFYEGERKTSVHSGNPTSTTGYIGLMYPSDYGYSVLASSCARTTNLDSYNTANCAGQSWLYGKGYEWTLTPYSLTSSRLFDLNHYGKLDTDGANYGNCFRPVLYLVASVYKIDGDGSLENPYIVG